MDLLKKHYEKILLGVVLLGLLGALGFLPIMIQTDRANLERTTAPIINPPAEPLAPLNLAKQINAVRRLHLPYHLDFETTNKLFNPVEWQRTVDGTLVKSETIGPSAAKVTKITPLYFILKLHGVETNYGDRYIIDVQRQAGASPGWREHYASLNEKNNTFTITSVKGPPANPTELVLQLTDSGETVTLSKNKPFRRVDAYTADLKYPPEGRSWRDRRKGDILKFANDHYIIVAIHRHQVVISAQSNQKKTTLTYKSQ